MKRLIVTLAVSATVPFAAIAPASASTTYFTSCAKLNRVFPHGVAKSPAAAVLQVRDGYGRPATTRRAKQVYAANHSRLDRDNDGTACER